MNEGSRGTTLTSGELIESMCCGTLQQELSYQTVPIALVLDHYEEPRYGDKFIIISDNTSKKKKKKTGET